MWPDEYTKTTGVCTLKGWTLWYLNYISVQKNLLYKFSFLDPLVRTSSSNYDSALSSPLRGSWYSFLRQLLILFTVPHLTSTGLSKPAYLRVVRLLMAYSCITQKRNNPQTHYCIPFITAEWPSSYVRRVTVNSSPGPFTLFIYSHQIRCESELFCLCSAERERHMPVQARKGCTKFRHRAEEVYIWSLCTKSWVVLTQPSQ